MNYVSHNDKILSVSVQYYVRLSIAWSLIIAVIGNLWIKRYSSCVFVVYELMKYNSMINIIGL